MDPMARAFSLGLERSHLFVGLFTQGLEGDDWCRRPPGFPNSALWTLDPPHRFFATGAAALAHLTHHEAHHTGCLSMLRRALGKDKVI